MGGSESEGPRSSAQEFSWAQSKILQWLGRLQISRLIRSSTAETRQPTWQPADGQLPDHLANTSTAPPCKLHQNPSSYDLRCSRLWQLRPLPSRWRPCITLCCPRYRQSYPCHCSTSVVELRVFRLQYEVQHNVIIMYSEPNKDRLPLKPRQFYRIMLRQAIAPHTHT